MTVASTSAADNTAVHSGQNGSGPNSEPPSSGDGSGTNAGAAGSTGNSERPAPAATNFAGPPELRQLRLPHRAAELAQRAQGCAGVFALLEEDVTTQLNLRLHPGSPAVARVEEALGMRLPKPNRVTRSGGISVLWQGPDEWLVYAPDTQRDELLRGLSATLDDCLASLVDVSANRAALRLSGSRALDVLESVCSVDLDPEIFLVDHCAQTLLGHTQAILWRLEAPTLAYRMLVRPSFAEYLVDLLLDAESVV